MIDLTKLQTFPTPEILNSEIALLRSQNATLTDLNAIVTDANKGLKRCLVVFLLIGASFGVYKLYKKNKDVKKGR